MLFKFLLQKSQSKLCAVYGYVQILQNIRQCTNMILMSVGKNYTSHLFPVLGQIWYIRYNKIYSSISSSGKAIPQSTTNISSPYSKTVMFFPISPIRQGVWLLTFSSFLPQFNLRSRCILFKITIRQQTQKTPYHAVPYFKNQKALRCDKNCFPLQKPIDRKFGRSASFTLSHWQSVKQ